MHDVNPGSKVCLNYCMPLKSNQVPALFKAPWAGPKPGEVFVTSPSEIVVSDYISNCSLKQSLVNHRQNQIQSGIIPGTSIQVIFKIFLFY
jgi:hypothetical protein